MANIPGTSGNDSLPGTLGNDTIVGFDGNDTLSGGGANDSLHGNRGADVLNGGSGFDAALYLDGNFGRGINANLSTGFVVDGFGFTDTLSGIEAVVGGDFADVITGSFRGETLNGGSGNDTVNGGSGNDSILGNGGDDVLSGGLGADTLSGSFGKNTFKYNNVNESTPDAAGRDIIRGFAPGSSQVPVVDRIDLSAIDADTTVSGNQTFEFIGEAGRNNGFTDAGQVRIVTGALTFVQAEVNGDGIPDLEILLEGQLTLGAEDFFL